MNPQLWEEIPQIGITEFLHHSIDLCAKSWRPLALFSADGKYLIQVMNKIGSGENIAFAAICESSYPSLSAQNLLYHNFERELWEEWKIEPIGHPNLKAFRYPKSRSDLHIAEHPFFSSASDAIHEVGVGPVHAGVIEPGHFRFLCEGEDVHHLEIQLGYQHRGVMELFKQGDLSKKIYLAENIAGDSAIAHGLAYCMAIEALADIKLSQRVQIVRAIALEMERIAMHLADISALAGDIAYLSGQNFLAALRTTVINSSLAVCGSRFGKRWLKPGGINFDIDAKLNEFLRTTLGTVQRQYDKVYKAMFGNSGVLSRFDGTGKVSPMAVTELGITGMAAKSCGINRDSREFQSFFPYTNFCAQMIDSGDVYARACLRGMEISQSFEMIFTWLNELSKHEIAAQSQNLKLREGVLALSIVEGFRGEIVHLTMANKDGSAMFYRIYDPSFHNWMALALSVRGNGISDFPVCNKSFNLSYCGVDL